MPVQYFSSVAFLYNDTIIENHKYERFPASEMLLVASMSARYLKGTNIDWLIEIDWFKLIDLDWLILIDWFWLIE